MMMLKLTFQNKVKLLKTYHYLIQIFIKRRLAVYVEVGRISKISYSHLLCRHPPQAVGRDSDKMKIKELLCTMCF